MCGRYVIVSKISEIEVRFQAQAAFEFPPNFNISPGTMVPVITSDKPDEIQLFQFGLTPFWAKKRMYFFNARAEGDHNKENNPDYTGAAGIISKPSFRKPIRSQRCLIIADAFIEGTTEEKLDKPHLVHLRENKRPFAFAGIWDEWVDHESGEIVKSCAIITTLPNALLRAIPHHRSPVILQKADERRWLDPDLPLSEVTNLLKPYDEGYMNAYPISKAIKNPRSNEVEILRPVGPPIFPDTELQVDEDNELFGMGDSRARRRKNS